MKNIKVALAGQPNCGKSTIFNMVSGIEQHIANYPGVTVDKKTGYFTYEQHRIEMVDLPGTYSFSSYSLEERVAKDFIIDESPDVIVNVIDASNIKRNLYLTFQLLEIGIPVVLVLNMMDVAKRRGIDINSKKISEMLNCPVVEASGAKAIGSKDIMKNIVETSQRTTSYEDFKINYDELEIYITKIENKITTTDLNIRKRWLAIKTLEDDLNVIERIKDDIPDIELYTKIQKDDFSNIYGKEPILTLAALRYESADIIYNKAVKEHKQGEQTLSDKVDKILLNRFVALPILIFLCLWFIRFLLFGVINSQIIHGQYLLHLKIWSLIFFHKPLLQRFL